MKKKTINKNGVSGSKRFRITSIYFMFSNTFPFCLICNILLLQTRQIRNRLNLPAPFVIEFIGFLIEQKKNKRKERK